MTELSIIAKYSHGCGFVEMSQTAVVRRCVPILESVFFIVVVVMIVAISGI